MIYFIQAFFFKKSLWGRRRYRLCPGQHIEFKLLITHYYVIFAISSKKICKRAKSPPRPSFSGLHIRHSAPRTIRCDPSEFGSVNASIYDKFDQIWVFRRSKAFKCKIKSNISLQSWFCKQLHTILKEQDLNNRYFQIFIVYTISVSNLTSLTRETVSFSRALS